MSSHNFKLARGRIDTSYGEYRRHWVCTKCQLKFYTEHHVDEDHVASRYDDSSVYKHPLYDCNTRIVLRVLQE